MCSGAEDSTPEKLEILHGFSRTGQPKFVTFGLWLQTWHGVVNNLIPQIHRQLQQEIEWARHCYLLGGIEVDDKWEGGLPGR